MKTALRLIFAASCALAIFVAGAFSRPTVTRLTGRLHGTDESNPDRVYDLGHYQRRSMQFAELHQTQPIVFLGDSRFEGAEWTELFSRCDISNRAISGDTTAGIVRRLPTSLPNAFALCVIQAGVNDLQMGSSPEGVAANYEKILSYVHERGARALVTSVLLVAQDRPELNAEIEKCNQRLSQLAAATGAQWLDVNAVVSPQGFLASEFTNDGVHLNGRGYLKIRDALAPYLAD